MRVLALVTLALAACAPVTPTALANLSPNLSIASAKSPHDFAMCVASAFPDTGQVLNDGSHYWVTRQLSGATFERWDFLPAQGGSTAERRTGQMFGYGADRVRRCA